MRRAAVTALVLAAGCAHGPARPGPASTAVAELDHRLLRLGDRPAATRGLRRALAAPGVDPGLESRAAVLAAQRLDLDGAAIHWARVWQAAPHTPLALAGLAWVRAQVPALGPSRAAIRESLAVLRGGSPALRWAVDTLELRLAAALGDREGLQRRVASGPWLRSAVAVDPAGRPLPERLPFHRGWLGPPRGDGEAAGSTWLEVPDGPPREVHLFVEPPGASVWLDEAPVAFEPRAPDPGRLELRVQLAPGVHRLRWSAPRTPGVRLALFDPAGRGPAVGTTTTAPTRLGASTVRVHEGDALGDSPGEAWIAAELGDPRRLPEPAAAARSAVWLERVAALGSAPRPGDAPARPDGASARTLRARAIALDPDLARLRLAAAETLADTLPGEARAHAEAAARLAPARPEPLLLLAELAASADDLVAAERALDAALARRASTEVLRRAAALARRLSAHARADRLEAAAVEVAGVDGPALAVEAWIRQGALDRAEAGLVELADERPEPAEALGRAAELALARGALARAETLARRALAADPGSVRATSALVQLLDRRGRGREADAALEALARRRPDDLELERARAARAGRSPGAPPPGRLAERLRLDRRSVVTATVPADWAGAERVDLLDRYLLRLGPDGRGLGLGHRMVRVQSRRAADEDGEHRAAPDAELLALRTYDRAGRPAEALPHEGVDLRSLVDLAPGHAWEQESLAPVRLDRGEHLEFGFGGPDPLVRAELFVVAPSELALEWASSPGTPAPETWLEGDQRVWAFVAPPRGPSPDEPLGVPDTERRPRVVLGLGTLDEGTASEPRSAARSEVEALVRGRSGLAAVRHLCRLAARTVDAATDAEFDNSTTAAATRRLLERLRGLGLQTERRRFAPLDAPRLEPPRLGFDRALIRVERPEGGAWWLDPTRDGGCSGRAPPEAAGGRWLRDDEAVDFDPGEVDHGGDRVSLELELSADGTLTGTATLRLPPSGTPGPAIADRLTAQLGHPVEVLGPIERRGHDDPAAARWLRVAVRLSAGGPSDGDGTLRLLGTGPSAPLEAGRPGPEPRRTPLLFPGWHQALELRLRLPPEHLPASPPPSWRLSRGRHRAWQIGQVRGRELLVHRRIALDAGRVPPTDVAPLAELIRAIEARSAILVGRGAERR